MVEHSEPLSTHHAPRHEPPTHGRPSSMRMSTRVVLGILAFVPAAIGVAILVGLVAAAPDTEVASMTAAPVANAGLYGGLLAMFLLLLFFGAFVMNNRRIGPTSKAWWAVGFLLAGPVTIPLYWYMHVLHAPHHDLES